MPRIVSIDKKRYKQVLYNLIGNAIKFTFNGGITIKLSMRNYLIVTECKDTGVGIRREDLDKLF